MSHQQFGIARMFGWVVLASLLCGLLFTTSAPSLLISSIGLSSTSAAISYRRSRKLVLSGVIFGFLFPTCLWLSLVSFMVRSAPVYNGQLYHEDGPSIFFFLVAIFALISGSIGAFLGACLATLLKWFWIAWNEPLKKQEQSQ